MKQRDHLTGIQNAKRLISKYAREEQDAWKKNLKDKGLWTKAQEEKTQKFAGRTDFDLYQRLEANFAEPRDSAPLSLEHAISQSMDDGLTLHGGRAQGVASSMEDMHVLETVQMVPQDEHRSEHDLGFMTEVDVEYKVKPLGGRES